MENEEPKLDKPESTEKPGEKVTIRLEATEPDAIDQRKICTACYWKGRADSYSDSVGLVALVSALAFFVIWRCLKTVS